MWVCDTKRIHHEHDIWMCWNKIVSPSFFFYLKHQIKATTYQNCRTLFYKISHETPKYFGIIFIYGFLLKRGTFDKNIDTYFFYSSPFIYVYRICLKYKCPLVLCGRWCGLWLRMQLFWWKIENDFVHYFAWLLQNACWKSNQRRQKYL